MSFYSGVYSESPAEIVEKRELHRLLQCMIRQYLSEKEKTVIYYLFYRELTQTETAGIMGITQPTVHTYLARALNKLGKESCDRNLQN